MNKCEDCDECVYICEGEYVCMKNPPNIVITEFIIPTELYGQCDIDKQKAIKNTGK